MLTVKQLQVYRIIQQYILQRGISPTVAEIAESLGIKSRGVIHRYIQALAQIGVIQIISGQKRNIRLNTTLDGQENCFSLPILGCIAAGRPIEAIAEQNYFDASNILFSAGRYLLQVNGDSMIGDNICDGDLIICEQQQTANNGQIVVALINQTETTLKRIYYNSDQTVRLVASNPAIKPMVYRAKDVIVQGIYLGLIRLNRY
jgi:repressor LexA